MFIIFVMITQAFAWGKFDTLYDALKVRTNLFHPKKSTSNILSTLNFKSDHNANVYLNNPILAELEKLQQQLLQPTPDLDIYTQNGVLVGFKLFSENYFCWNSLDFEILFQEINNVFLRIKFETNICQKPDSITYNQFILINTDIGHWPIKYFKNEISEIKSFLTKIRIFKNWFFAEFTDHPPCFLWISIFKDDEVMMTSASGARELIFWR